MMRTNMKMMMLPRTMIIKKWMKAMRKVMKLLMQMAIMKKMMAQATLKEMLHKHLIGFR
jgi:hypothetical protein